MPFLKINSTLPCKCFVFFDYVREQSGVSFCFQTIKHELGFRKRVVSTVSDRVGGKYPFRGHPTQRLKQNSNGYFEKGKSLSNFRPDGDADTLAGTRCILIGHKHRRKTHKSQSSRLQSTTPMKDLSNNTGQGSMG